MSHTSDSEPRLLSVQQAAARLGLKAPTVRKMIQAHTIAFVKLGARVLFDPARLDQLVRERTVEPIPQRTAE